MSSEDEDEEDRTMKRRMRWTKLIPRLTEEEEGEEEEDRVRREVAGRSRKKRRRKSLRNRPFSNTNVDGLFAEGREKIRENIYKDKGEQILLKVQLRASLQRISRD